MNGAEDDYYQTLNPPYKSKNGRFDTVEELLLVKGITPTYFYGYPERTVDGSVIYRYGLSRYFTVYSNRNQINVNYAPLPVLLSVPGMPAEAATLIYERRLVKPFKNTFGDHPRDSRKSRHSDDASAHDRTDQYFHAHRFGTRRAFQGEACHSDRHQPPARRRQRALSNTVLE